MEKTIDKLTIKETIVVEGKDDYANIKRFVNAEIIITHGFGLNNQTKKRIQHAAEIKGIIILTDPDFAGENIRKNLVRQITGNIKHAYITREEGNKKGNIGVENAEGEAILSALKRAKPVVKKHRQIYKIQDMQYYGLAGEPTSKALRIAVGKHFRIGYGNAKQLCERLNNYQITKKALEEFLERNVDNEH